MRIASSWWLGLALVACSENNVVVDGGEEALDGAAHIDANESASDGAAADIDGSPISDGDAASAHDASSSVDAFAEGTDGASADAATSADATSSSRDAALIEGPRCDPERVICRLAPPTCSNGEIPSVIDDCWGPCIAVRDCACDHPGTVPGGCPEGYACYNFDSHCGPLE